VVEVADQVLPLALDELAGEMIQKEMESQGVKFYTSDSASRLSGSNGKLKSVHLQSGEQIEADIFVIAVGVRPNVDWLRSSDVTIDRGIVVDERMRTSVEDVYAAGDCAQGLELISGSRMVLATIPVASEQGMVAGYNMAGVKAQYKGGIPLNALQFGRQQIISYGYVKEQPGQEVMSILNEKKHVYKKVVLEDDKIVGALFLRAIDRAGLFRYLIENKVDVGSIKHRLLADDFSVASLPEHVREEMFSRRRTRIPTPAVGGP